MGRYRSQWPAGAKWRVSQIAGREFTIIVLTFSMRKIKRNTDKADIGLVLSE